MPQQRIPLAWKNLVHQPRRLIVAVCGIGFAVVLMFMQLGFRNALFDSTVALHRMLDADLVITSTARYSLSVKETFSRRRLAQALGCPQIAEAYPLYIETAASIWKNPETGQGHPIRVLAFNRPARCCRSPIPTRGPDRSRNAVGRSAPRRGITACRTWATESSFRITSRASSGCSIWEPISPTTAT